MRGLARSFSVAPVLLVVEEEAIWGRPPSPLNVCCARSEEGGGPGGPVPLSSIARGPERRGRSLWSLWSFSERGGEERGGNGVLRDTPPPPRSLSGPTSPVTRTALFRGSRVAKERARVRPRLRPRLACFVPCAVGPLSNCFYSTEHVLGRAVHFGTGSRPEKEGRNLFRRNVRHSGPSRS